MRVRLINVISDNLVLNCPKKIMGKGHVVNISVAIDSLRYICPKKIEYCFSCFDVRKDQMDMRTIGAKLRYIARKVSVDSI